LIYRFTICDFAHAQNRKSWIVKSPLVNRKFPLLSYFWASTGKNAVGRSAANSIFFQQKLIAQYESSTYLSSHQAAKLASFPVPLPSLFLLNTIAQ
jgi:hypothetical protein